MNSRDPRAYLRPIRWTIAIFTIIGLLMSQAMPLEEWQRWLSALAVLCFGLYWFLISQYVLPRHRLRGWMIYANIAVTSVMIAVGDYLIAPAVLTPLYLLLIITTAILWNRLSALSAATIASTLTLLTSLVKSSQLPFEFASLAISVSVYLGTALLVSELTFTLTTRWQAAVAEAQQQRQEIARRNQELEGLYDVSRAFGNLEDAQATVRQVTERIARLLKTEICAIASFSPESGQFQGIPPGFGIGDDQIKLLRYPPSRDHMPRQLESLKRDYVLFNDIATLPPSLIEIAKAQNIQRFATARMLLHGQPLGVIAVANKVDGGDFEEEDGRLLSILAGEAAIAVENARLYKESQTNLRDSTRLYAISAQLVARYSPAELPQRVVQTIADALGAPAATIALLNESTHLLEYVATIGVPEAALKVPFPLDGVGMTVLHSGEPRFVEDMQFTQDIGVVTPAWDFRAAACLPIRHGDKSLGVLYVNYSEPHPFTTTEKNLLAIFANQTAIALENAKLLLAEQRRAKELAVLSNLSRSLAETMDLEEMFGVFEQQVHLNMPAADAGALLIYDRQSDALIPRASFGFERAIVRMIALLPGESVAGQVFQNAQPTLVSGRDAVKATRRTMRPDNQALFAAAAPWSTMPQSVICAPVVAGGETFGVVMLDNSKSPEAFTSDDLQFLVAMADRIALAIRNAHLFAREQRRASQLATVNDLGHHVSSILNMDELAFTLVRLVRDKFGYPYVHLFINDPAKGESVLRAGVGSPTGELVPGQFTIKFNQGIVGWTAVQGKTLVANDVSKEARYAYYPALAETRAEIAVPLVVGPRVVGVLDIQSEQVNAFETSDVATLETLAGQVAIAIENARLYGETQEQARRDSLTQVYNHRYFLERLNEEIEEARRSSKRLSLIMLDIDHFKEYNDSYGHVLGDLVLSTIVQAIRARIHSTDLVGRWGGEEFAVALLDADSKSALYVAQRIHEALAEVKIQKKDGTPIPPPTISQGIASFPTDAHDTAALVDRADSALYRAKSRGRDQVYVTGQEE